MNTGSTKQGPVEERETSQAIAEQRAKQSEAEDEDSARVGLLRITRPLDISSDEQDGSSEELGGDPYNSTGRFTRSK